MGLDEATTEGELKPTAEIDVEIEKEALRHWWLSWEQLTHAQIYLKNWFLNEIRAITAAMLCFEPG